ncbi:choline permease [Fusarium mundagurra]|uniref:Choline permease n=1 Tax=Fusarium mundagurra TaxID=1567541 RepID=A0A8H5YAD9_9HYPO|nr:choline permease [Fusarium mundagurra]
MDPPKDDIKAEPISYDGSIHEGSQSQYDTDDAYLKSLGKSAELHRVYNFWTLCAYQVMISATWTCVVVFYGVIFDVGGPASLLYGSIIVAVGQTLLMASLAEYCGIWPTAGGQQFYVQKLATEKYRPFLSYFVGWCLLLAETATGSSCALNTANITGTMVTIFHPNIDWKPSALPLYSTVGAVFTILGFFGWAITLLATAPKASAEFVFTKFINNSGYTNNGWVFILSFYTPLYGLYGTDSMMHLVEEMKNASQDAPRAMVWSMVLSGVATIVTDLILLFCCGNYTEYATALSPYVTWFSDVAGSEYAGIYVAIVFGVVNLLVCTGILSSCSRLGWRMAEDRAFPWSHRLQKIDPKLQIPLNFIFAIMVVEVIIGLISLGSELAYNAIVSGAGVCFALAYAIPVTVALVRGRSILPPHPHFDLGRWGYFVNYVAVAWAMLTIVIYVMPLYLPVTGENIGNMNWASLIVGATFLFSGVWWIFGARFKYLREASPETEPIPVAREQSSSS